MPEVLYEAVVEVKERVILHHETCRLPTEGMRWVTATNGETLWVFEELDAAHLEGQLRGIREQGIASLAVVLMHSYIYPAHEEVVESVARKLGFKNVSLSSKIMPMVK